MPSKTKITALVALALFSFTISAKENVGGSGKAAVGYYKALAASCSPATAQIDLDINNVRTTLLNGGDIWWDLNDAKYEVPKIDPPGSAPSVHSLFAGAIWLGGIDAGGQLKIAAQTYRQTGNDFWPGPLDDNASITDAECLRYDRHWRVNRQDIEELLAAIETNGGNPVGEGQVPQALLDWPAKGNCNALGADNNRFCVGFQDLAPFFDADEDGIYDPTQGDYPVINSDPDVDPTYADEMIFWVYNDKGNIHTETGGQAIGIQVNALAFAFATSDEVNDMTFYRYNLINQATLPIGDFYMAQWVDPDLGCFNNDYVGCDTSRSLGICYNGTATDPDCATRGYGSDPPLIGIDYFEGPLSDPFYDLDSNLIRKQLGMSTFTYYNNDFSVTGNPETAVHYYNYMIGKWKDNTPFTSDACDAKGGTQPTTYMFPSPPNLSPFPQYWSECSCSNPPADRRFLQASGPFTLEPGAVNNITVGAVWVRPQGVYPCPPFETTIGPASDKAQALFDNNFKLVDGPDAPTLAIRELDQEIIISLVNESTSNNINESYNETDPVAAAAVEADTTGDVTDSTYTFEGYKLYQLVDQTVSAQELNDVNKARLVAQVDINNGVAKIINYEFDPVLNADVPELKVDGADDGIRKTFRVTEDLFATGSKTLVNHKTYYFTAIAYAYNNYKPYDPGAEVNKGQNAPYLQGRRNYNVYSAIPHQEEPGRGGTVLNASYGDGVEITRLEGEGNGGLNLELTEESVDNILNSPNHFYGPITYKAGQGPLEVQVYDPMKVKNATFVFSMMDTVPGDDKAIIIRGNPDSSFCSDQAYWKLEITDNETGGGSVVMANKSIEDANEQLIQNYGISIRLRQVSLPGKAPDDPTPNNANFLGYIPANGFIEGTIDYDDPEVRWLTGVMDQATFSSRNWIRAGQYSGPEDDPLQGFFDDHAHCYTDALNPKNSGCVYYDPNEIFEHILDGTWAPYALAANWINKAIVADNSWNTPYTHGPAFPWRFRGDFNNSNIFEITENTLHNLHSVDVVLTDDKSKWTRCVVVELGEDPSLNEGGARKGWIRRHASWDKEGRYHDGTNTLPLDTGRSWFPGYAINVETGERLNIMFGESSWLIQENGRDMIWNPTSNELSPLNQVLFGGKHHIYIMDTRYDEGRAIQRDFLDNDLYCQTACASSNPLYINPMNDSVYQHIMWVSTALLADGYKLKSPQDGIIPNDVKIRLRVNVPYAKFVVDNSNGGNPKYLFTTEGLNTEINVLETAKTACDEIRAVPNPYYAFSAYETNQLDNKIKITNLPDNCTVSIYTLGGTLIRRFERAITDDTSEGSSTEKVNLDNSIEWDLKNNKNIPVASGIYLIHVKADGVCEKVIKWFGALRPIDLDTF